MTRTTNVIRFPIGRSARSRFVQPEEGSTTEAYLSACRAAKALRRQVNSLLMQGWRESGITPTAANKKTAEKLAEERFELDATELGSATP